MADLSRSQLVLCAVGAVVVLLLGARHLGRGGEGAPPAAAPARAAAPLRVEASQDERVLVHVAGAVHRPGVYRLRASSRVDDAVRLAGGATRRADLAGLNLAANVEDGRQVLVPERVTTGASAVAAASASEGAAPAGAGLPVNLNTATLEQLDVLPGIGPAMAQRILEYREANGGFGSVEELTDVPGIAEGRMAALRDQVQV
jgi:competence protein ComEA